MGPELVEKFREFLREEHIKECDQCQKDGGKLALTDTRAYALSMFKKFMDQFMEKV